MDLNPTVKTALVIICLYREGHHAVRNKGDVDSVMKTKTSNLAFESYLNMLYSGRYGDLHYSANFF